MQSSRYPQRACGIRGTCRQLAWIAGDRDRDGVSRASCCVRWTAGEPRNADLALSCTSLHGRIAISVEGKSRETFGDPIYQVTAEAARKFCEEISTNSMVRLQNLFNGLFRYRRPGMPRVGELRYQLLTAAAGALVAAREIHAVAAALVIHEFRPPNVREDRYLDNARDLSQFLHRLGGGEPQQDWWGPYAVPGNAYLPNNIPLFIGKVVSACDPVEPIIPRRPEA
jgi:hypothetical protein